MLMKLGRRDITETNHAGIDHRANAVFYAPDKHSIKGYKKKDRKIEEHKSKTVFVGCPGWCHLHRVFIVATLCWFVISPRPDVMERCVKLTGGPLCCRQDI